MKFSQKTFLWNLISSMVICSYQLMQNKLYEKNFFKNIEDEIQLKNDDSLTNNQFCRLNNRYKQWNSRNYEYTFNVGVMKYPVSKETWLFRMIENLTEQNRITRRMLETQRGTWY